MSTAEREVVTHSLPAHIDALPPPDGEPHSRAKWQAFGSLDGYLRRTRKGVYVGVDLAVYYPAEPVFAPDLLVVLDTKPGVRMRWDVNYERQGLDFVLEIHHHGARSKDLVHNVTRYARLGIREYFVFDRKHLQLLGWRLPRPNAHRYVPIVPQRARLRSHLLRLDLAVDATGVRFLAGDEPLPWPEEFQDRLTLAAEELQELRRKLERERDASLNELTREVRRRQAEQRKREAEQRKREAEQRKRAVAERRWEQERRRREILEARLAELLAKSKRPKRPR
jgi:Uma2 family endonuclease